VESLLGDAKVSSLETRVVIPMGHNFLFDRWITFKILKELPNAVFLGIHVESLLGAA